jgi:hypothetical protein
MKVVSKRLGHAQISVTADLYTHVSNTVGRAAADKIARALKPPTETLPSESLPQTPENDLREGGEADAHP